MKNLLLGSVALVVWAGAVNAADLPRMPVKAAPAPVVGYDWNGFYIGGYYGTAVGEGRIRTDPPGNPFGTRTGQVNVNSGGITLGGTVGYNWQFAPAWLVGLEADAGTLGIDRTFKEYNDVIISGSKANWYGTLRGRFGYVTGPSLLYVTGGAAFVHITDTFGGDSITIPATAAVTTRTGWTVGAGIETKLSRNWTTKTEYLFIDAGSYTVGTDPFGTGVAPGSGGLVPTTVDHTYHVIKTGLNYKLDGTWEGLPFFGAPLLPSDHSWGGFYAGVNVGGGMSLVHAIDEAAAFTRGEEDPKGAGLAGGGQIGYNYMITPRWFVGAEGDIGYLGVRGSVTDWFDTTAIFEAKTNWYATARVRFGSSTGPALLYITAGGAWVNLQDGFAPASAIATGDLTTRTASGWTIGGGTEVALNSRWSATLESLYIDVGHRNATNVPPPGFSFNADFKDRFMVVRAGLNYKFGAGDVISSSY
jgi:outer membrane immunogenic protein